MSKLTQFRHMNYTDNHVKIYCNCGAPKQFILVQLLEIGQDCEYPNTANYCCTIIEVLLSKVGVNHMNPASFSVSYLYFDSSAT